MGWLNSDPSNFKMNDKILERYIGDEEIVWVPRETRIIASHAFENCSAKSIWIQRNIELIMPQAFNHCRNLQAIIFGEAEATAAHISRFAVCDCPNLTAIEVPHWCKYFDESFPPHCRVIVL